MKYVLAALLMAGAPLISFAQGSAAPNGKPAAKSTQTKPAANKKLKPSAVKAVEEATPIEPDPGIQLSDADLDVARKVYVGDMKCELGNSVKVTPHGKREGFFVVTTKGHRFHMHPVESRTGAIRLEDTRRGAMWLQLGNKSMLMSQKLGQRLADECQSPEQVTHAEYLKTNPLPNLLEDRKPAEAQVPGTLPVVAPPAASAPAAAAPVVAPATAPAAEAVPAPQAAAAPAAPAAPAAAPAGNLDTTVAP
jgi:hypothetical protein